MGGSGTRIRSEVLSALSGTVPSFVLSPTPSRPDRGNIEADALIIRRVEPQQPVKNTLGLLEPFQSPQAQPEAVHAAQERAVVEPSPGQQAIGEAAQREFADPQSHLVVAHRIAGDVVEDEVTEVSMGVEAAEVGLAKFHEDLACGLVITRTLQVVGADNGIAIRIVGGSSIG